MKTLEFNKFFEKSYNKLEDKHEFEEQEEQDFDVEDLDLDLDLDMDADFDEEDVDDQQMDFETDDESMLEPETQSSKKVVVIYAGVQNMNTSPDACLEMSNQLIDDYKSKGYECELIKLYHLNIQPVSEQEPADGMQSVYEHVENASIVVLTTPVSKGNLSGLTELFFDRMHDHYDSMDLKNVVFSAVLCGENDSANQEMADLLYNAYLLGMLVPAGSMQYVQGQGVTLEPSMVENSTELQDVVAPIRPEKMVDYQVDGAQDFDSFVGDVEDAEDNIMDFEEGPEAPPAEIEDMPDDFDIKDEEDFDEEDDDSDDIDFDQMSDDDQDVDVEDGDADEDLEDAELEDDQEDEEEKETEEEQTELSDKQKNLPKHLQKSILKKIKEKGKLSEKGKKQLEDLKESKGYKSGIKKFTDFTKK